VGEVVKEWMHEVSQSIDWENGLRSENIAGVSLASATASALIRPAFHHRDDLDLPNARGTMCDHAISTIRVSCSSRNLVSSRRQQPTDSVLVPQAEARCTTLTCTY
jgi:hypothetical protein